MTDSEGRCLFLFWDVFVPGCLILGGDFNIPLNPTIDASSGKTCITYRILKKLKLLLNSLQLIDSWCFHHPEGRDFTFYFMPHNRYSRIDYLFISHRDLSMVSEAHVGIQSISDHAPISLAIDLTALTPKPSTSTILQLSKVKGNMTLLMSKLRKTSTISILNYTIYHNNINLRELKGMDYKSFRIIWLRLISPP